MRRVLLTILASLTMAAPLAAPIAAQVQLPGAPAASGLPPVGGVLGDTRDRLGSTLGQIDERLERQAQNLLRARDRNLNRLLRRNLDAIERDADGDLARAGELIALDLTDDARAALEAAGFTVLSQEKIEGLDISATRIAVRPGDKLDEAEALAWRLAGDTVITPDNLHYRSGAPAAKRSPTSTPMPIAAKAASRAGSQNSVEIGVIDGAPGASVRVLGERGFARGAPRPSDHGSAVASLLKSTGIARIRVADVYGSDPAGGNALAIARAIGWLTKSGSRVITISLVGPRNALVERAVSAAQSRGVVIVAAVGNDGPAAPPAFPASYPGVVAVTGVDRRGRALIEAGRALDLDYAAPGDRVYALDARGRRKAWRGTSFATPLVAARIGSALSQGSNWRRALDSEARDLGAPGPDDIYGRGLVCAACGQKN